MFALFLSRVFHRWSSKSSGLTGILGIEGLSYSFDSLLGNDPPAVTYRTLHLALIQIGAVIVLVNLIFFDPSCPATRYTWHDIVCGLINADFETFSIALVA